MRQDKMDRNNTFMFAVRHGETEWNITGKHQGHIDNPRSQNGIKQAHALADDLLGKGIEIMRSSDLGHAAQTAEIIGAKLDLLLKVDKCIRERHLGIMQGMIKQEFRDHFPKEFPDFCSGDPDIECSLIDVVTPTKLEMGGATI